MEMPSEYVVQISKMNMQNYINQAVQRGELSESKAKTMYEFLDKASKDKTKNEELLRGLSDMFANMLLDMQIYTCSNSLYINKANKWFKINAPLEKIWQALLDYRGKKMQGALLAKMESLKSAYLSSMNNLAGILDDLNSFEVGQSEISGQKCFVLTIHKEKLPALITAKKEFNNLSSESFEPNRNIFEGKFFISQMSYLPLGYNLSIQDIDLKNLKIEVSKSFPFTQDSKLSMSLDYSYGYASDSLSLPEEAARALTVTDMNQIFTFFKDDFETKVNAWMEKFKQNLDAAATASQDYKVGK